MWWLGHWFTDEPVMQCGSDVVVIAGLAGKWTPDYAARSNASALIVIPDGTQCRAGTQRGCRMAGSRVSPKRLARDDNKIVRRGAYPALVANLRKFAGCHVDVEVIAMVGIRFGAKRRAENPAGGCMCFMQKRSCLRLIAGGVARVHDDRCVFF